MVEKIQKFVRINGNMLIVFFIVIFAGLLRYKGLIFQSHWFDELFSVYVSNPEHTLSTVISKTLSDVHPPLYQILLWIWYNIFGYSDWSGRVLSALFGTLGVYTLYLMSKEFYNKEVGVYAAVIASVNYFLIYFSQETRAYALVFLLTTLSYMYFFRLANTYHLKNMILYILFTVSLMYTHYYGLFLVFTQVIVFLYMFMNQPNRRKELLRISVQITVILSLAISPLIASILRLSNKGATWMETPSSWFVIDYMKGYVLSPFLHKIFLLMIIVVILTMLFRKSSKSIKLATYTLFIWIIIGYLVPYIRSIMSVPLLSPKNTIIMLPALITLISFGVYKLKYHWIKLTFIFSIVFFSLYHLYRMEYYDTVTKDQFREVLYEIDEFNKSLPIYDVIMHKYSFKSYYFDTHMSISKLDLDIRDSQELRSRYKDGTEANCFWVVQAHKNYLREGNLLQSKDLKKLKIISKHQAEAILYGYKMNLYQCKDIGDTLNKDIK